jgi:hypothetical protein
LLFRFHDPSEVVEIDDKCVQRTLAGKPEKTGLFGTRSVDGRIILKWIVRKHGVD